LASIGVGAAPRGQQGKGKRERGVACVHA
jgi:hypothetical protein